MAIRVDWKTSLLLTAVLFIILYSLRYFIQDQQTYCIAAVVLFVAFFIIGNLLLRRK